MMALLILSLARLSLVAGTSEIGSGSLRFDIPLIREEKNGGLQSDPAAYWGKITVADVQYRVVFDTGSGHLILPSQNCTDTACIHHTRYPVKEAYAADGSPLSSSDELISIDFGTGDVHGPFAKDKVCLDSNRQCADNTLFIAATNMNDRPFSEYSFDGVFGLGLSGLSMSSQANLIEQFGGLLFAIGLHGNKGIINFGRWDPSWFASKSSLQWSPVHNPDDGYWTIDVNTLSLAGTETLWLHNTSAVIDSGTSVISVPSHVARAMRRTIEPHYVVDGGKCVVKEGDVDIEIRLGSGMDLILEAHRLMRPRIGGEGCKLEITALDVPPPLGPIMILGEPLFRKYYIVFDARTSKPRIGFAHSNYDQTQTVSTNILEKSPDLWWDAPLII